MKRTIQKKFMSLILAVAMVISLMPLGTLAAVTTSGNWTDSGNYTAVTEGNLTISTEMQLAGFTVAVNGGADFSGYTVTLTHDLNLSAHYWTPIGNTSDLSGTNFRGTFNGAGHTISNLVIGTAASPEVLGNAGLFGYVYCGSITNIGLLNVSIYNSGNAGGLVGTFNGTNGIATPVTNSYVTGSVSAGGDYAGGLIGNAGYCGVSKCYAVVSVTGGDATMAGVF